jgi:rhomboid family GlyGly-CTERM serine protease
MLSVMRSRIALADHRERVGIRPLATLMIGYFALVLWMLPAASELFQFDRTALEVGRWWLIFTGHLTHWSGDHILWDLATFLGLGILCEGVFQASSRRYLCMLLVSALSISFAVYICQPTLAYYRGLSGLCVAQFAYLTVVCWKDARDNLDAVMMSLSVTALISLVAKTSFEIWSGQAVFVDLSSAGYVVVPLAHLVGAVVGVCFASGVKTEEWR